MWQVVGSAVLLAMLLAGVGLPIARSGAPGGQEGLPVGAPQDRVMELHGTVQSVDRQVQALRVAHYLVKAPDTVLQITDATQVRIGERAGSLADIRQGTRIRASYQDRYGINVARSIEVVG